MKYKFKKDKYARARGASQWLLLGCAACNQAFALYQKDGPGSLIRLYIDRIFAPEVLANFQHTAEVVKDLPNLACTQCQAVIGTPMVYELEKRLAFRLKHGTFTKKKCDGVFPSE